MPANITLGGMILDTSTLLKGHDDHRIGVRWPVTILTPNNQLEGVSESISLYGMLLILKESPPRQLSLRVIIKISKRQTLSASAKVINTSTTRSDDGSMRFGAELYFTDISQANHQFLRSLITMHYKEKVKRIAHRHSGRPKLLAAQQPSSIQPVEVFRSLLPVSYGKSRKMVKAWGSRFSTIGCHVHTKETLSKGTTFTLKIRNPLNGRSVQVTSTVVTCKRSVAEHRWDMMVYFQSQTKEQRLHIRRMLQDAAVALRSRAGSKHLKSKIRHKILKYFDPQKLEDSLRQLCPFSREDRQLLEQLLRKTTCKTEFQRVQCLWLLAGLGLSPAQVAKAVGWESATVKRVCSLYFEKGAAGLVGDGEKRQETGSLSLEEERISPVEFGSKSRGRIGASAARGEERHINLSYNNSISALLGQDKYYSQKQACKATYVSKEQLSVKPSVEQLGWQVASRAELEGITISELVHKALTQYMANPITLDVRKMIVKRNGPHGCGQDSVDDCRYLLGRNGAPIHRFQGNGIPQADLDPGSS